MCIYLSIQICAATASMSTNQTNQCAGKVTNFSRQVTIRTSVVCSMHTVRDNSGDDDDVDATLDLDNFSGNI